MNKKLLSLAVLSVMVVGLMGSAFAQETTETAASTTATTEATTSSDTSTATETASAPTEATTTEPAPTAVSAPVEVKNFTLNVVKEGDMNNYSLAEEMVILPNSTFQIWYDKPNTNHKTYFETAGLEAAYMCPKSQDALGMNWEEYKTSVETKVTESADKESCLKDFYIAYLGDSNTTIPADSVLLSSDATVEKIGNFVDESGNFKPVAEFKIVSTTEENIPVEEPKAEEKKEETKPVNTKETGLSTNILMLGALVALIAVGRKVLNMED